MTAKNSENTYFYIHDHLGSTSMVLDVDGNISQSVTYIPYGEIFVEERIGTWNFTSLLCCKKNEVQKIILKSSLIEILSRTLFPCKSQ